MNVHQKDPKLETKRQEFKGDFKEKILNLIHQRDIRENKAFHEIFQHHERLFENWAAVRAENLRLSLQVQRGSIVSPGIESESSSDLGEKEQRIRVLQEELTNHLRKKGETAAKVLELKTKLAQTEEELANSQSQCAESVAKCADLEEQVNSLQDKLKALEATNELLRDEHQALHLAFSSLEKDQVRIVSENKELVQRFIEIKAKHADIMNQENENFVKKKQARVQKDLEEAAAEIKNVNLTPSTAPPIVPSDRGYMPSLAVHCVVPTTASDKFDAHESEVNAVRWSLNGRHFATGGVDRKVKIWESVISGVEPRGMLTGSNGAILSVDFDPASSLVLAASSDFACRVWTLDDLRLRHTLTGHSGKVLSSRFMNDPSRVVSGSHDRTLKIWDLRSRACVSTKFAGSSCNDLVCVGDGSNSTVISGHFDKRIRFWDLRTESPTQEVSLPGRITSLDIPMDQNLLLASIRDDSIQVLDLRMNSVIGQYSAEGFKMSSDFSRATFSPDGQFIACGSADGGIYIWNVMESKLETCLREHTSPVGAVHWHPKGDSVLSVDRTKKTVLWTS